MTTDPNQIASSERDVLISLCSYLGCGLPLNASAEDLNKRIRAGIDDVERMAYQRAADVVEQHSKQPKGITWGRLKSDILGLAVRAIIERDSK